MPLSASGPNHDPTGEVLDDALVSKENLHPEEKKQFDSIIRLATHVLNKHPDADTQHDDRGKPMAKTLVDDVDMPRGTTRVWLKLMPFLNEGGSSAWDDKPSLTITLLNKFDSPNPFDPEFPDYPARRVGFYSGGFINAVLANNVEALDHWDEGVHLPEDGFRYNFSISVDSTDPSYIADGANEDRAHRWIQLKPVEDALQALDAQV